jgi:hypothetical protein
MLRRLSCALAALIVPMLSAVRPAFAATTPSGESSAPSAFALPMSEFLSPNAASDAFASSSGAIASEFAAAPPDERSTMVSDSDPRVGFASRYVTGTRYESSRYRPRRERSHGRGPWRGRGVSQIHAGFLDPDGSSDAGFLAGFRGGQRIDDVFEIGLGLDWRNKSGRTFETAREIIGPGGEPIIVRRDISRYSSNLFPALLYIQLSGPSHLAFVPYAGAAASWQVLFLEADDFTTGERFDATFDGFGWQLWGGAAFPLSGRSRLIGEVFMNQADLNRDVFDPTIGQDVRETVSTDGLGARFGMSWGF